MPRTAVSGSTVPSSELPFSPAVRTQNLLFVSGQASVDDTGRVVPDTLAGELARAMDNLDRILAAAGLGRDDVVSVRCYVGDWADREQFNRLYAGYFTAPRPARTTTFGGIGSLKVEIDAVAEFPTGR